MPIVWQVEGISDCWKALIIEKILILTRTHYSPKFCDLFPIIRMTIWVAGEGWSARGSKWVSPIDLRRKTVSSGLFITQPPPLDSIDISDEELEKNMFLRFCSILNNVTGIVGGLSSLIHLIMLFLGPWSVGSVPSILTRSYFIGFGIMIVLQEREWDRFFQQFVSYYTDHHTSNSILNTLT